MGPDMSRKKKIPENEPFFDAVDDAAWDEIFRASGHENGSTDLSETFLKAWGALQSEGRSSSDEARGAIPQMWREIAAGQAGTTETTEWAAEIAKRVVSTLLAEKPDSTARGKFAIWCLGLKGRADENYSARQYLGAFLAAERFDVLDDQGHTIVPAKKANKDRKRLARLLRYMRDGGYYSDLNDKSAISRIGRLEDEIFDGR